MQRIVIGDPHAGSGEEFPIVIAATPASDRQRKFAIGVFITMALVAAITLPFAKIQFVRIDAFVPAVQFVICAANLFTAVLLFAQYSVYPQRALLALASGYVFSGLFAFLEACFFPGTFASTNLIYIGDELNSAAWLFIFWHTVFPLSVIVYALSKQANGATDRSSQSIRTIIGVTIACVVAACAGLTWLATAGVGYLPSIYTSANVLAPFAHYSAPFLLLLSVTTLVFLFVRRHSILDQWLLVVLLAWLPTFAVAALFPVVRFTAGWYMARLYALLAGSALLFVLLTETVVLYTRLANAIVQLRRAGRAEHLLAAIVKSSDDAIFSTDINGQITTWNNAAERLFGYCEAEAVGRPAAILVPPDHHKEIEKMQRVRIGESLDHFETVRQRKDGNLVNVSITASPISESGRIVGSSRIVRDITERKRAEVHQQSLVDELNRREASLQEALSAGSVIAFEWDATTDLVRRSNNAAQVLGINPKLIPTAASFLEWVHPDDRDRLKAARSSVHRDNATRSVICRFMRPDGQEIWLHEISKAEFDATGRLVGVKGLGRDITERKRAEEHDALLRLAQASTGLGVWVCDMRTKKLSVPPELEELFGLKPGSMKNYADFRDRVHPDDIEYVEASRDAAVQKHQRFHHEFRIIHPNGETRWMSSTGSAVYDEVTGAPLRILGSNFDITERKQAEERQRLLVDEINHREASLQDALAAGSVITFEWDAATDLVERSNNAAQLLGYDPKQALTGKSFLSRVHPDDVVRLRALWRTLNRDNARYSISYRYLHPNGRELWFQDTSQAEFDDSGRLLRVRGLGRDITELKRAEDRQELLVAELDHRVKNILAQVAVVATSTRQGSRSIDEFLGSLNGRIQSMATAHTLLSESGWQSICLDALVRNELAPYAAGSNVTISGTDILLDAAETQAVARVLHELATNAAKYGALSIPRGHVFVNWDLKPNGAVTKLNLVWRELDGPPVASEHPSGYGTDLIRNLIPHELGGTVDLVFATEGVNCRIGIPVAQSCLMAAGAADVEIGI